VPNNGGGVSRRGMIRQAAAAVAGGAAAIGDGRMRARAQSAAIGTGAVAGRRFKAWVTRGWGPSSTTLEELQLLPIAGRQLLVRTEASQLCYSCAGRVAGVQAAPNQTNYPEAAIPEIQGHGAVGIVEAIGPDVSRVRIGDRVVVNVLPHCGRCYGCVTGRRRCMAFPPGPMSAVVPFAEAANGTKVTQWMNVGGFAELIVPFEESVIPVVTSVPARELAVLHCVAGCGLGMAFSMIDRGSDVVVFGSGPVGLSSVQGARILGASQIISVDPVKMRRDVALKVGATAVVDPNVEGKDLVPKLREMCKAPSERLFGGGVQPARTIGPDYIIEAVGQPFVKPQREAGPDGLTALQQMWQLCPDGGKLYTCGVGFPAGATISLPVTSFTDASKTHYGTTNGSSRPLRDIPRNVRLIEQGLFDAKSLVTATPSIAEVKQAYKPVLDYTTISAVMVI
jgi:S-(hydroxymethyl)glutathione dehydrogenase/alcohol dehydrogenase